VSRVHPLAVQDAHRALGSQDADGVLLTVEVSGVLDATPGDLVALADSLREAAAQLAPSATTTATVEFLRGHDRRRRGG
jgi:hypothetical protein